MESIYVLSVLATYGAVLLLGVNRGEISRLWIYLAVLFQIPAAVFIARTAKSAVFFFLVACTLVAQSDESLSKGSALSRPWYDRVDSAGSKLIGREIGTPPRALRRDLNPDMCCGTACLLNTRLI